VTKAWAVMILVVSLLTACSREKIDWKSAEAADTVESYDHFIERHPDSPLATQARTRVTQLNEDRDWKRASSTDTADAYRQFLTQHDSGKWAEEARIRIENFSLDGGTGMRPTDPVASSATGGEGAGVGAPASAAPSTVGGSAQPKPGTFGPRADASPTAAAATSAQAPVAHDAPPQKAAPARPAAAAAPKHVAQAAPTTATKAATPTTPPAHPTGSAAPPDSSPQFGIQLGAFHSQEAALTNWKALQAKYDADLHGLFARAVPIQQSAGQLFRLQAPVGEESRARSICASLARKSQPCVVVLPQPH
jgi:cell division septation protein DedD